MSSAPLAMKHDVPKELWNVASTLTKEAQEAALKKCKELNFDTSRGRISLEETLINLSEARDVILDAVRKNKIAQLPLSLQYSLLDHLNQVGNQIVALTNGTDAVIALESATEQLTASIWTYQLRNLSGEVLGLQTKLNQAKALETTLREASREADKFAESREFASGLLDQIKSSLEAATAEQSTIADSVAKTTEILRQCAETQQKTAALSAQVQQNDIATAQQLANATQAAANIQTLEKNSKEVTAEVANLRTSVVELERKAKELLTTMETESSQQLEQIKKEFASISTSAEKQVADLTAGAEKRSTELATSIASQLNAATSEIGKGTLESQTKISALTAQADQRLNEAEKRQDSRLQTQLQDFTSKHETSLAQTEAAVEERFAAFDKREQKAFEQNKSQFDALVNNLNDLEGQIKESIRRATGHSLFHSFQTRQEALRESSRFWMKALAGALVLTFGMGIYLIYELRSAPVNGIFFLRLALSIPLFFAVGFCAVQYGRERRLEEEYAFKANISISLDPYQELVKKLVKDDDPAQREKYTSFIIDSITKVFTSPTDKIFDAAGHEKPGPKVGNKALKEAAELLGAFVKEVKH